MRNTHILAAIALACASTTFAATLTPDQALSRATMGNLPLSVKSTVNSTAPTLVSTQTDAGEPTVYVFGMGNDAASGYLVVSADDVAPGLLGYSTSGDATTMPPAMKYWIAEYGRQIQYARAQGANSIIVASDAPDFDAIEPMTTTRWNQDAPFNDDCPTINGTHCVTGCVATALSQIMKYHNWPAKGTGSNSYTPPSVGSVISVDYANTTYDWDNMIDVYTSSATDVEKAAVANLMYSCGVAVNMDYTTSESSASSFHAATAMIKYFDYDKGVGYYVRDYYTLDDWNKLVYDQLSTYGPVQYSGQSNDGGHSFVCDGYSSGGYFHINWGWGGMSDGYFLLTALDPGTQGIGGSTSGYNFSQDIIGNVKPSDGSTSKVLYNFVGDAFECSDGNGSSSVSLGNRAQIYGPYFSMSLETLSGFYGLKLVDADGNVKYLNGAGFSDLAPMSGSYYYTVLLPSSLADGTYKVYPAVRDGYGNWFDVPVKAGAQTTSTMTVANGVATFDAVAAASLTVTDVTPQTEFYIGSKFEITANINNPSTQEYVGSIRLVLVDSSGNAVAYGDQYPVDLSGGDSENLSYISSFTAASSSTTLTAGSYQICFIDDSGNQISDMQTITLNAASTPTLKVTAFDLSGDKTRVSKTHLTFNATIECTAGYYGSTLTLVIFPYEAGNVSSVAMFTSDPLFIESGETKDITISGDFSNGTDGKEYFAMLYKGSSPLSYDQVRFTLDDTNSVTDVTADQVVATEVYDLNGRRIANPDTATKGIYLVRTVSADGSVSVSKVMR